MCIKKSFTDVQLNGNAFEDKTMKEEDEYVPLKLISNPLLVGGNIVIEVHDEEYNRGVKDLKFSVIGQLALQQGDPITTTMEMRRKLSEFRKINDLKVIPLGEGTFHILLCNLKYKCKALSLSSIILKLGVLRLNSWVSGYNSIKKGSIL